MTGQDLHMFDAAGTDMSRKADVIVTEIFDSELLGEGILSTMRHAKLDLLKVLEQIAYIILEL